MSALIHSENRAFNYAVLASIALHAALLFGVSVRERARPVEPAGPLVARLIEAPATATAPAPAVAAAPRSEPVKPQAVARPRPKPAATKPVAKAQPAPIIEPAAEPAAEAPQPNDAAATVASPAATAGIDAAPAAPAAVPQGEGGAPQAGTDARSVAEYRLQLIGAAQKYKRYPRAARENNSEGVVALRMAFSASGRVAALNVTKTSGYNVLDQQAVEMFKSAAAAVPVPPPLRGKDFAFDLAVIYEFKD